MATEWVTPRCPGCGGEPLSTFIVPHFCTDDDCRVLTWDPALPGYQFKARAETMNLDLFDGPG
jgi:hypothetical protein